MKNATGTTVISNGQLVDGTGAKPLPDAVLVITDGKIVYCGPPSGAPKVAADAHRIDARGGTIMPGLVEAHFHATYFNVAELTDLDIKYPVEYVTLLASINAKLALECGYTAARSGGSLFNVDVWLKKAIESDLIPGPRLASSGRTRFQRQAAWQPVRSMWFSKLAPTSTRCGSLVSPLISSGPRSGAKQQSCSQDHMSA